LREGSNYSLCEKYNRLLKKENKQMIKKLFESDKIGMDDKVFKAIDKLVDSR